MSRVEEQTDLSESSSQISRCRCCCSTSIHIKKATLLVSYVSAFFVIANFLIKIAGYSETAWDWEFLFLIVDSIAVASLIYGVYSERAAFLQPFVVLSIVTTSFLILLGVYLASAVWNPNSYAGLDFELQLHKRFSVAAHKLPLEFKHVVSIVAAVGLIGILMSIVTHSWFIYLAVQCAKYFRMLDVKKGKEDP